MGNKYQLEVQTSRLGVRIQSREIHFANAVDFVYVVSTANDPEVGEIMRKNIIR